MERGRGRGTWEQVNGGGGRVYRGVIDFFMRGGLRREGVFKFVLYKIKTI